MEYKFSKEEKNICEEFAANKNTSFYARRGQNNAKKRQQDAMVGKLGEFAVCSFLRDKGFELDEPDTEIYKANKKSFKADLFVNGIPIHVKSQSAESAERYGSSWTFQFSGDGGGGHFDPIIAKPEGLLVCVKVLKDTGVIEAAITTGKAIPRLLEDPVLEYLKRYKRMLYLETLKKNFEDLHCLDILEEKRS